MKKKRCVVIAEMYVTQYRAPFYQHLRELLAKESVELRLLTGKPTETEAKKNFQATLGWETPIPCRYLARDRICWMPFGRHLKDADLVIVTQENKLIYNLWLMFVRRPERFAFWGHGRNMQSADAENLKERFKRWTINKVDWWFAYTRLTASLLAQAGFPQERITVVENSADTGQLAEQCARISAADVAQYRQRLGLTAGPVGLYLGSLAKMKRVDFLLDAVHRIRQAVPGFQMIVAGAGSEQGLVQAAAGEHPWIHYVGHLQGSEKALALTVSDILLNPGAVGLGILDSFVSGTPYFTTHCGTHGPEIAYLDSGRNGVITADDIEAFSGSVIAALQDENTLATLKQGALASASQYSVENMANRYAEGILECLASAERVSVPAPAVKESL